LSIPQLRWLTFHTEVASRVHYVSFSVPKKSGGTRTLSAPHRKLAAAQEWVLANIVNKLPVEKPAHGFITGRSILSNAQQHTGRAVVLNMDLEGFFPSITFPRVRSVFRRLGYSWAVATILALLCTECPRRQVEYDGKLYHVATGPRGLPQGACTSPGLSNQVARRLDKRLSGLAAKLGLSYTRYADDLTFSGNDELKERVGYVMARVRHIAGECGFSVNEKKSRVLRRNTAQRVTGLVVNDRPGVSRREVRRLRAILHRARTEGLAKQNRENHPDFRAWLLGKIAYVSMARPETGARLRKELERLPELG
jgi:retron-type reverse transcriptase